MFRLAGWQENENSSVITKNNDQIKGQKNEKNIDDIVCCTTGNLRAGWLRQEEGRGRHYRQGAGAGDDLRQRSGMRRYERVHQESV